MLLGDGWQSRKTIRLTSSRFQALFTLWERETRMAESGSARDMLLAGSFWLLGVGKNLNGEAKHPREGQRHPNEVNTKDVCKREGEGGEGRARGLYERDPREVAGLPGTLINLDLIFSPHLPPASRLAPSFFPCGFSWRDSLLRTFWQAGSKWARQVIRRVLVLALRICPADPGVEGGKRECASHFSLLCS